MASFEQALQFHQQGKLDTAEQMYRSVLRQQPEHTGALINLGQLLRQQGHHEKAIKLYKQATAVPDAPYEAWFNLGNAQAAAGRLADAEQSLHRALARRMDSAPAHYRLGSVYRRLSRFEEAVNCFTRALELDPTLAAAALDMGNVYRTLGRTEAAIESYRHGLSVAPDDWRLHYSLARLYDTTRHPNFRKHFDEAVRRAPEPWQVLYGLAETRVDDRNYAGAEPLYRKCLELEPGKLQAAIGLGAVLMRLDRQAEAEPLFTRASGSNDIVVLSELARVIWEHKFFAQSVELLERIVELEPGRVDTLLNLATAYLQTWNMDKALAVLKQAREIDPANTDAAGQVASIYAKQGRIEDSLAVYREQLALEPDGGGPRSSIAFTALYSDQLTATDKAELHREMSAPWLKHGARSTRKTGQNDKIRIGYVSADFRNQHPVGIFITPVIESHDREQFDIFCYYNRQTYDETTHRLSRSAHRWHDVAGWSDERLASLVADDRIDILVDLGGHTSHHRLSLFGRRVAPVQVSMIGYPHSTGLEAIDCMVVDPWVCPPGSEHLFAEQVERLPMCIFNYLPEDIYGPVDVAACERRNNIVFGSFNNIPKITPTTVKLWAAVIDAVPNSVLRMKAPSFTDNGCCERYRQLFAEHGVGDDRLQLVGPSSLDEMMREYNDIDIGLDPVPFNGGTTTVQALWMGVPVVTLAGDNFCGRMGVSVLSNVGLPNLIAETETDYIEIAKSLANDKPRLLATKSALREQMKNSPLCDSTGYTRALESIYHRLHSTPPRGSSFTR